jgi:hypothetical protein
MTPLLKQHIRRLPEKLWRPCREKAETVSECANVLNYLPEEEGRPEGAGPLCYVGIRVRKRQGELCADGSEAHYLAVATNQCRADSLNSRPPRRCRRTTDGLRLEWNVTFHQFPIDRSQYLS